MSVDEHLSEKPDLPRTRHDSASAGVGAHAVAAVGEGVNAAVTPATTIAAPAAPAAAAAITPSTNQTLLASARLQRLLGSLAPASSNLLTPPEPAAAGSLSEPVVSEGVFSRGGVTQTPPGPLPQFAAYHPSTGSQLSINSFSFLSAQSTALTASLFTTSARDQLMMALLDPEFGIPFVTGTPAFPKHTFCSYDLVQWLQRRLEDITSVSAAVAFAQSLLDAKLICHASGNPHHRFLFGFFFYTLLVEFLPVGSLSDVHEPPHATTKAHHSTSGKSSVSSQSSINPLPPATTSGRRSTTNADAAPAMQILPFPKEFLPQTLQALSAFSVDFQKEWIEVLFIRPESTLHASSRSASLPTPGLGDNPKASAQREFCPPPPPLPLPPPCPLSLTDVVSKAVLDGIFSTDSLKQVFGPDTNANVHVGTEGILRKRHTSIAQESSPQDHCSEWYCLLYDMNYNPTCGFSLEIQWLVASGCRIADSLLHIYRRASNMGFHFFPVPCYPFGYRGTRIVLDPLRIPIFVPCTLTNFVDDAELRNQEDAASSGAVCSPFAVAAHLFPKTRSPSAMSALYEFQSLILSRFGFIPLAHFPPVEHTTVSSPKQGHREMEEEAIDDDDETPRPAGVLPSQPGCGGSLNLPKGISFTQRTYVHVSGGMFVMIPIYSHVRPSLPRRVSDCCGSIDVPHLHTGSSVSTYLSSARSYETSLGCEVPATLFSRSLGTGWIDKQTRICNQPFSGDSSTRQHQHSLDPRTYCFEAQSEVGFFWTWNHMLPRKWRGQLTGDEAFQDGMLEDFRRFCSGADDRLASLLSDYRAKQQQRYSS